jgi:ABC-type branched-subunit amino acid transport system substrate-binding protein
MGAAAGQVVPKDGTVALVETPGPFEAYGEQLTEAGLKSAGFTGTVKIIPVQAAATDYAPAVAQAQGADALVLGLGQAQAQAFLPALAQADYSKLKIVGLAGNSLAASVVKANAAVTQGATIVDYYPPFNASVWQPFRDAIAKYGTSAQKSMDYSLLGAENAWIGFQILREVGAKMTGGITTAQALTQALHGSASVATNGIIPTLNFTKPFGVAALRSLYNTNVTYDQASNGQITWPDPQFHDMAVPFTKYMG